MIPSGFLPIANHLWQSTLFAGIAGLLTLFLRNNRAHTRYFLWLAASAKFLVPFSLLMLVGGLVGRHSVVVPAPTRIPVVIFEQMNEPFVAEVPLGAVAMPHGSKSGTRVVPILVALWAIGCGALMFSWCVRWRRIRVAVRAASPVPLGIGVPALSSASIIEPGVFGVFRPVLLLPDGIGDRLAPAELQAILAHELCHVRRRDNLATLMHMVVEAVFWFHPLVWWLGARLMDEREQACDEEVLRMGSEAEAYAEGILKVCELYLQSPLKCVAGVTGANLKKRIEAMMANRPMLNLNLPKKVGLMLAGILAVGIPVILGIINAPELRAQAQSVPKQDITGTWQGKLPVPQAPNGEFRVVFKILKADGGTLKATLYTIDRPSPGSPASTVAIQGSNVKITIPGIGGTYEGKMDADAITLTGKWTMGGMPLPLTLAHVKDDAAWEIPKPPTPPKMMAADANPVFEVATVKPSDPNRRRLYSIGNGTEVTAVGATVNDLIVFAYGVHARQISGAPAWVESDKFDIRGKPEGGRPNPTQFKMMLQKLLADRFQLAFHRDKKQLTVYALTVGKNGPKLTRNESASPILNLIPRGPGNCPRGTSPCRNSRATCKALSWIARWSIKPG
jgi:beta-lactamase regulating signal transducer with metallopeptidase domain